MRTTKTVGLLKPDRVDKYDVNILNSNLQTLDERLGVMGGARANHYTNAIRNVIVAKPGNTITEAHGTSAGRIGYIRISFTLSTDLEFTAIGRLIGGSQKVGVLTPEYAPISNTNLQSVDYNEWGCEGAIQAETAEVYLSSVSVRPGITKIPKGTTLQLASAKYILKVV